MFLVVSFHLFYFFMSYRVMTKNDRKEIRHNYDMTQIQCFNKISVLSIFSFNFVLLTVRTMLAALTQDSKVIVEIETIKIS
jgi:hypothetical protein